MSAQLATIWNRLITALQGIDGTGAYTHDLSATGAVQRIRVSQPMLGPPFAVCVFDECPSQRDIVLNTYRRDCIFTVVGWASTPADTDAARATAAVNMFDDLLRALEADPTLGGIVYDVSCSGRAFVTDSDETGAQYPVAIVRVEVYLRVTTGA